MAGHCLEKLPSGVFKKNENECNTCIQINRGISSFYLQKSQALHGFVLVFTTWVSPFLTQ